MKVEEIMSREVKVCALSETLNGAAQLMWENDCGCIPVVEGDSKVVGMLTDRDICMAAYTRGATLHGLHASSAMSRELFACRPGDDLLKAQQIMREHRVRRLPVTDTRGKLVGILSLTDVARAAAMTNSAARKAKVADTLAAVCAPHPREATPQSTELKERHREGSREGGRRRGTRRSVPSMEGPPRR